MDISNMDIIQFVKFINAELQKDKNISVNKLCDKLSVKKSTLKSKMARGDYSYNVELRQYIKHNITEIQQEVLQEVAVTKEDNTGLNNIDIDKLNLLLNNLDSLLSLVTKKDTTSSITIDSKETRVTSLRINQQVYDMIKERATKENTSISDIVNRSLLDYLNNYI